MIQYYNGLWILPENEAGQARQDALRAFGGTQNPTTGVWYESWHVKIPHAETMPDTQTMSSKVMLHCILAHTYSEMLQRLENQGMDQNWRCVSYQTFNEQILGVDSDSIPIYGPRVRIVIDERLANHLQPRSTNRDSQGNPLPPYEEPSADWLHQYLGQAEWWAEDDMAWAADTIVLDFDGNPYPPYTRVVALQDRQYPDQRW